MQYEVKPVVSILAMTLFKGINFKIESSNPHYIIENLLQLEDASKYTITLRF